MASVNLANVNLTIKQFQDISSGQYNAGEVRLTSDHSLGKINHHISLTGSNKVSLSHAEVLAIKDAFVRALSANGVGVEAINRVRQQLGLAPAGATDRTLAQRSIKPLSREQIRTILDDNAEAINAFADTHEGATHIQTDRQLHARWSRQERASFAQTRKDRNAALVHTRATVADRGIADTQAVIAGDIHFKPAADRKRLIEEAERQKAFILQRSHGTPSVEPNATIRFSRPGDGLNVTFSLGMSEADYVKKLDDMLTLLSLPTRQPSDRTLAAMDEFSALDGNRARINWTRSLPKNDEGGFKLRTAFVAVLKERGIDDYQTLSMVNKIKHSSLLTMFETLTGLLENHKGNALRNSQLMGLMTWAASSPDNVPPEAQAYIPALSAQEANQAAYLGLIGNGKDLSHEMKTMADEVVAEFAARYGADTVPAGTKFPSLVLAQVVSDALGRNGDVRRPVADVKAAILAGAAPQVARRYLAKAIGPMLAAAGSSPALGGAVASNILARHPELRNLLASARSPAEARNAIDGFQQQIAEGIRRQMAVDKCRADALGWYREELAAALGVPVATLQGRCVNVKRLASKGESLGADIGSGTNPANTDQEIEAAYRQLAHNAAQERIALLRQADQLDLAPAVRDIVKEQILSLDKVTGFDLAALKTAADAISVKELVTALSGDTTDAGVLDAMGVVGQRVHEAVFTVQQGGQILGRDEIGATSNILVALALNKEPEALDLLRAFFLKSSVMNTSLVDLEGQAARAVAFEMFRPDEPFSVTNAAIADAITDFTGQRKVEPIQAQALYRAMDDLGLGDLPALDKANLLLNSPGEAIAAQVRSLKQPATPTLLRAIARPHLVKAAALHAATRHAAAFARRNGIDPADIDGFAADVLFKRHPQLREQVEKAVAHAAALGEDPAAATNALLAQHDEFILVTLRSLAEVRRVSAGARETAINEIAQRANLDVDFVREKLVTDKLRDALNFLGGDIRDALSNPATNIATWNVADVTARAEARVTSFIEKKAAFLAEVNAMHISDAAKGSLILSTLREPTFTDAELAAAADRVIQRNEIRAAFDYAKNILAPEKIAGIPDEGVFQALEIVADHLHAAIEAELPAEKRAAMDHGDNATIRSLLATALIDHCGETLLSAISRLSADGRIDKLNNLGDAIHRRHAANYDTLSNGRDASGKQVPVDLVAAAQANRNAAVTAFAMRILDAATVALDDAWLPADLSDAVNANRATPEQKAIATAAVKRAPALFDKAAAGLNDAQRVRLKAFAVALDYRDAALSTSASALNAAADALRLAASPEQAEAALDLLAPTSLRDELATHGLAANEPFAAIYAVERNAETGAITVRAMDADGLPVRFSRNTTVAADGAVAGVPVALERAPALTPRAIETLVANAASAQGVALNEAKTARAVELMTEFSAGMFAKNARLLARFIVSLDLTDATAELDRRRVEALAREIAKWRDFGLTDIGREAFGELFKVEANDLIREYMAPDKAGQFVDDHFKTMGVDINRGTYTIAGTRFHMARPVDVLKEFDKIVTTPKAKRALSILMSQASAMQLVCIQAQIPLAPSGARKKPLDPTTLPGAGAFVSRNSNMTDLFLSPNLVLDPSSLFDLVVSEDGSTATLKIIKDGNMIVGTVDEKMGTAFGRVVVEEELTIDLNADIPTVTNVRVSQAIGD